MSDRGSPRAKHFGCLLSIHWKILTPVLIWKESIYIISGMFDNFYTFLSCSSICLPAFMFSSLCNFKRGPCRHFGGGLTLTCIFSLLYTLLSWSHSYRIWHALYVIAKKSSCEANGKLPVLHILQILQTSVLHIFLANRSSDSCISCDLLPSAGLLIRESLFTQGFGMMTMATMMIMMLTNVDKW